MAEDHLGVYRLPDFDGHEVEIPCSTASDYPYFRADEEAAIRSYYEENGYAVVRGLLPPELCDAVQDTFEAEVRPFRGYLYRQTTARPERHVFTDQGFLLNTILNIQSVDRRRFGRFRDAGLALMTHRSMQRLVTIVLGGPGKLVQSMYFEGNPTTPPHQDTYYLDAEEIGRMTGAWVALEAIEPDAGRFFVYPKSHLIDMPRNGRNFDIAFHHDRYKELVKNVIREHGLVCRAPAMNKGDVLFFAAKIIHGSMPTTESTHSRRSVTAHFIPSDSRFLQFQTRIKKLDLQLVNGMAVHHPKDLSKARHRAILFVETMFPEAFRLAKKLAIKLVIH